MTMLQRTNEMLMEARQAGLSLRAIADLSDGTVDLEWLKKFARGSIGDPSYSRVQSLHDALTRSTGGRS
jgi:hypothetical protein